MRKLTLSATLIMVMMGTICDAQVKSVSSIGAAITAKEGQQWIANYNGKFQTSAEHFIGKAVLLGLMQSEEAAGFYLIKGLDNEGNERLMMAPATQSGMIVEGANVVLTSVKPESATQILDQEMMQKMAEKFQQIQQPEEFGAHLYGKKVFEELLSQPGAAGLFIGKGLDANQEHLVLTAIDKKGEQMWANVWNHGSGIFAIYQYLCCPVARLD
ncbi:MAG: hypothetical protein ACOYXT_25235 [Bacteroidota bacterium]